MKPSPRAAQPGDIFLLLIPPSKDKERLSCEQLDFQAQFGGQPVEPIHVTVERFSPDNQQLPQECVANLRENLSEMKSFPIMGDAIIQFFAPYWQSYVLRWRVQKTPEWIKFRDQIKSMLEHIDCPSHFDRRRHATCTILKLGNKVILPTPPPIISMPLFKVQDLRISTLREDGNFEVLEKLKLRE